MSRTALDPREGRQRLATVLIVRAAFVTIAAALSTPSTIWQKVARYSSRRDEIAVVPVAQSIRYAGIRKLQAVTWFATARAAPRSGVVP